MEVGLGLNETLTGPHYERVVWEYPEGYTLRDYAGPEVAAMLHPHWLAFKPLNPLWYYMIGLAYFILGVLSIFGNAIVLLIFSKYKSLRSPANMLVMNLALSDLILMICLFPECIWNFWNGGPWQFNFMACIIHAFTGALLGYTQIMTLTFISYDRYNVIVNGIGGKPMTYGKVTAFILFCWIWGTCWSVTPLFGFGGYAMDGIMGACSFDYLNKDMINRMYIVGCFVFCYVFPLIMISYCYFFIVKAVWNHEAQLKEQAKKMNVASLRSNADSQKQSAEIRIAKVAMINISLWTIAWTPFAVVCLIGVLGNQALLTPLVSSLPALFAKTSCVYNPVIYAISHPKYRECLKKEIPWMCITENSKSSDNQSTTSEKTNVQEETEKV